MGLWRLSFGHLRQFNISQPDRNNITRFTSRAEEGYTGQGNLLNIIKSSMEELKQKNSPWLSVPQFGDWDMKNGQVPDYSLDFSKIRENRKQNKRDASQTSINNDEELVPSKNAVSLPVATTEVSINHRRESKHSPSTRRSIFSYFNCCAKASRQ